MSTPKNDIPFPKSGYREKKLRTWENWRRNNVNLLTAFWRHIHFEIWHCGFSRVLNKTYKSTSQPSVAAYQRNFFWKSLIFFFNKDFLELSTSQPLFGLHILWILSIYDVFYGEILINHLKFNQSTLNYGIPKKKYSEDKQ